MTRTELDQIISEYVAKNMSTDGTDIVTGWILCVSVKHPSLPGSDGYVAEHSEGMPYHTQLGLLHAITDEKRGIVMAQIAKDV